MTPQDDPFDLQRFVDAQAPVLEAVKRELAAGRKRTHWMWFVFPQLTGLGVSAMAQHYAIRSLAEARAYLAHPVLGPRLRDWVALVIAVGDRPVDDIFVYPDTDKFRSCLTLFALAAPQETRFEKALDACFGGERDRRTIALLSGRES